MPEINEQEFLQLPPEQRQGVLKEMRAEKKFLSLPTQDRQGVLQLMQAVEQNPQEISKIESAVRGAAQGASFGFADEIIAGLSAAARSFVEDEDFRDIYLREVQNIRQQDVAAEAQNPKTFAAGEMAGALATTAIPGGAGMQAGRGFVRGLAGIARGAAAGAATAAGKSTAPVGSEEFKRDVSAQALASGALQGGLNVAGPIVRSAGKVVGRNIPSVGKAAAISTLGFTKTKLAADAVNTMKKSVGKRFPEIIRGLNKFRKAGEKGAQIFGKFAQGLIEAFEKQGGAGLIAAHKEYLQDPEYRKFLNIKEEKD